MTKRFNPSVLFEAWKAEPGTNLYPTPRATLDAVRAGTKGLAMFNFDLASMTSRDAEYLELLRLAFDRDLVVVLQSPRVFVARPDELWRIPAYLTLWKTAFTNGSWSDAAEAQASLLLGYTDKQRAVWLAHQRFRHAAWGCVTIYTLVTRQQRRLVLSMGKRCFGPEDAVEGMTFFFRRGGMLKRNARTLVPKDLTIARVGLERDAFHALFGPWKSMKARGLVTAIVPSKLAASTNAALASNVQFLTRSGWD